MKTEAKGCTHGGRLFLAGLMKTGGDTRRGAV